MVFDAPGMKSTPFNERLAKLREVIDGCKSKYIELHEHRLCESREDLVAEMDKVTG